MADGLEALVPADDQAEGVIDLLAVVEDPGFLHLPDDIRNGGALSDSLVKAGTFPLLAVDMVRIGETSANLPGMLKEIAEVYDQRTQARINTFVSLIEPVIIIFMGLMVAAMLLAVYLPIFNIIKMTR